MKQKQYSPLSVAQMGLSLYAVNEGYLDEVEVAKVGDYEAAFGDVTCRRKLLGFRSVTRCARCARWPDIRRCRV